MVIEIKLLKLCEAVKPQDMGLKVQKNLVITSVLFYIPCVKMW